MMIPKAQTKSLIGIAKDFVPSVHYVEDGHVLPQSIAGQNRAELYSEQLAMRSIGTGFTHVKEGRSTIGEGLVGRVRLASPD